MFKHLVHRRWKLVVLVLLLVSMLAMIISGCTSTTKPQGEQGNGQPAAGEGTQSGGNEAPGETYLMKLGHAMVPEGPRDRGAQLFKEIVEEKTGGRLKVEIYPSSQLGDNRQMVEGMQLGTIEGMITPTAFLGGFNEILTVCDLPFLFSNQDIAMEILDSEVGEELLATLEDVGVVGIDFWAEGSFKQLSSNFPIRKPSDFKGKKIRTMDAPVIIEQFKIWGGSALPINFAETYTALQLGTVDGQENRLGTIYEMKFHEVQDYITISDHGNIVEVFMASKKWWDSLPADIQTAIKEAAREVAPTRRSWGEEQDRETLAELEKLDSIEVYKLTEDEWEAFRQASEPIFDFYAQKMGERGEYFLNAVKQKIEELS